MLNHPVLSADSARELIGCCTASKELRGRKNNTNIRQEARQFVAGDFLLRPVLARVARAGVLSVQVLASILRNPQGNIDSVQMLERLQDCVAVRGRERIHNDQHLRLSTASVQKTAYGFLRNGPRTCGVKKRIQLVFSPFQLLLTPLPCLPGVQIQRVLKHPASPPNGLE